MGWTSITSTKSFEEVFQQEFASHKVIKSVFKHHTLVPEDIDQAADQYVVFEHKDGYKFICVILWQRQHNEVYWKDMDESMGPYSSTKCPKEILEAASPIEELPYVGYAKEWREKQ